ncbi:MAG TPA: hypothetical protein VFV33_26905 [Gemmatimonadaceae bacterium]|nr:hypothetical protein [Gemmatimonadaceae bacterium]
MSSPVAVLRRLATPLLLLALPLAIASCSDDSSGPTTPNLPKELNSGTLAAGVGFQHTFASAGSFPYHCTIHPSMTGTVTVAGGGADSVFVNIAGNAFAPQAATVKPGGTVRWKNNDGVPHTVTSN